MVNQIFSYTPAEFSTFVRDNPAIMILVGLGAVWITILHAYLKNRNADASAQNTLRSPIPTIKVTESVPIQATSVSLNKEVPIPAANETVAVSVEAASASLSETQVDATAVSLLQTQLDTTSVPVQPKEEENSLVLPEDKVSESPLEDKEPPLEEKAQPDSLCVAALLSPATESLLVTSSDQEEVQPPQKKELDLGASWGWIEENMNESASLSFELNT